MRNSESEAAARMRALRAHRGGDHRLCAANKCPHAAGRDALEDEQDPPGSIAAATATFVESLGFAEADPRHVSGLVAIRLAAEVDRSANSACARELSVILRQISEIPGQPAGPLDEVRLNRARRRVDQLIDAATRGVS